MSLLTVAVWDLFLQFVPRVFSFCVCRPYLQVFMAYCVCVICEAICQTWLRYCRTGSWRQNLRCRLGHLTKRIFLQASIVPLGEQILGYLTLAAFISPWHRLLSQGRSLALWLHCEKAHLWQVNDRYPFSRYIVCSLR